MTNDLYKRNIWRNFNRLHEAIYKLKNNEELSSLALVDSWMLWLHYKATASLYLLIFVTVAAGWYAEHPMVCVNLSDRSEVWDYFKSLCLSYSYANVSRIEPRATDVQDEKRVYAAHYRWLHWVCLLLMCLYYAILVHAKSCSVPHVFFLMNSILETEDENKPQKLNFSILLVEELGWNSQIYTKLLGSHLLAFFIDIISVLILDTLLQHQFITLVVSLYPFKRDSEFFSDPLSLLFPPFVTCQVGPEMMLLNYQTQVIGCHLTLMEFYEKIVVGLWFWKAFLLIFTPLKILHLVSIQFCPRMKRNLVKSGVERQEEDSNIVASRYSVGDLFVLSKLRQIVDGHTYRAALHHAAFIQWPEHFDEDLIPEPEAQHRCQVR